MADQSLEEIAALLEGALEDESEEGTTVAPGTVAPVGFTTPTGKKKLSWPELAQKYKDSAGMGVNQVFPDLLPNYPASTQYRALSSSGLLPSGATSFSQPPFSKGFSSRMSVAAGTSSALPKETSTAPSESAPSTQAQSTARGAQKSQDGSGKTTDADEYDLMYGSGMPDLISAPGASILGFIVSALAPGSGALNLLPGGNPLTARTPGFLDHYDVSVQAQSADFKNYLPELTKRWNAQDPSGNLAKRAADNIRNGIFHWDFQGNPVNPVNGQPISKQAGELLVNGKFTNGVFKLDQEERWKLDGGKEYVGTYLGYLKHKRGEGTVAARLVSQGLEAVGVRTKTYGRPKGFNKDGTYNDAYGHTRSTGPILNYLDREIASAEKAAIDPTDRERTDPEKKALGKAWSFLNTARTHMDKAGTGLFGIHGGGYGQEIRGKAQQRMNRLYNAYAKGTMPYSDPETFSKGDRSAYVDYDTDKWKSTVTTDSGDVIADPSIGGGGSFDEMGIGSGFEAYEGTGYHGLASGGPVGMQEGSEVPPGADMANLGIINEQAAPPQEGGQESVQDDVPREADEGDYILPYETVLMVGLKQLNRYAREAIKLAMKNDIDLGGTDLDPTDDVPIKVSNYEFHIPKVLVPFFGGGKKYLDKIQEEGLELRKRLEEEKQPSAEQQQPQPTAQPAPPQMAPAAPPPQAAPAPMMQKGGFVLNPNDPQQPTPTTAAVLEGDISQQATAYNQLKALQRSKKTQQQPPMVDPTGKVTPQGFAAPQGYQMGDMVEDPELAQAAEPKTEPPMPDWANRALDPKTPVLMNEETGEPQTLGLITDEINKMYHVYPTIRMVGKELKRYDQDEALSISMKKKDSVKFETVQEADSWSTGLVDQVASLRDLQQPSQPGFVEPPSVDVAPPLEEEAMPPLPLEEEAAAMPPLPIEEQPGFAQQPMIA